jgi:hypothetical protein
VSHPSGKEHIIFTVYLSPAFPASHLLLTVSFPYTSHALLSFLFLPFVFLYYPIFLFLFCLPSTPVLMVQRLALTAMFGSYYVPFFISALFANNFFLSFFLFYFSFYPLSYFCASLVLFLFCMLFLYSSVFVLYCSVLIFPPFSVFPFPPLHLSI